MSQLSSLEDLGQAATAVASAQPEAPVHVQKLDKFGRAYATGKRKNAVARVWVKPGSGKIIVNDKDYTAYFARPGRCASATAVSSEAQAPRIRRSRRGARTKTAAPSGPAAVAVPGGGVTTSLRHWIPRNTGQN